MKILAIDTSCDETSVAVTQGTRVLSNVISSQVRYHRKFGGVVPFLAQRLHKERIESVVELALKRAKVTWKEIEAIAVTQGPGLAPALEVGIEYAQILGKKYQKPVYAVNHMAGHIAACFADKGLRPGTPPAFPLLAVLVSGGHTELVLTRSFTDYTILGQTLDDALGEAYDKVAKMLGLGYPGGKILADLAKKGDATRYELPVPMKQSGDLNLSYSGLKNAVRLLIEAEQPLTAEKVQDIAASFERVAQASLLNKVEKALSGQPEVLQIALGGGVAANLRLRKVFRALCRERGLELVTPPNLALCTDNAAMIGVAAWFGIEAGQVPVQEKVERVPYLSLEA